MRRSDAKCLAILEAEGPADLSDYELYRARVLGANNGLRHEQESILTQAQQNLLEVRRLMKAGSFPKARDRLFSIEISTPIILAEKLFLLGAIAHRSGEVAIAKEHYLEASRAYGQSKDEYRRFRAMLNGKICENDMESYFAGALFSLQQEAKRNGFYELVGLVEKARAGELFSRGQFAEAAVEAESAVESLSLDGCPEDLAVARLTAALSRLVTGDMETAQKHFAKVCITGGKLAPYQNAYQSLLSSKTPVMPQGHPLENAPWPRFAVKQGSVLGKILRRIQTSPVTPDQLIEEVWGKNAIHPSYRNRLFTAINKLKKTSHQTIVFDGQFYRLK